ncbi:MAG: branched-chain amino acid ABC transporter permease [Alphaproteobacteria bacterium]|nr:branched-chain amino acid ABC transporter permease [Alphaproteobacteria bacterium]
MISFVLLAGAFAAPAIANSYQISVLFFLFIAVAMTETYDITAGYMGYLNLGHGAFFGIGAYIYGMTVLRDGGTVTGLILSVVAAMAFASVVGYPLFRLRGAYFAIATFGILKLMEVLASNLRDLTGGTTGLSIPPTDGSTMITYYLSVLLCVASVALNAWFATSRFGLGLLTIREDEEVAEASGVQTGRLKLCALVASAALPGFAGAIYMWQTTYIDPDSGFGSSVAFAPVIMAVLGGGGTIVGPLVGTVFLTIVQEVLWSHVGYLQLTMYGVVLISVGIMMPGGLMRSRLISRLYALAGFPDHYGYYPSRQLKSGAHSENT